MADIQMGKFKALVSKFYFLTYNTLFNMGGANGELSIHIASEHEHMECITFDLPKVTSIAKKKLERGAWKTECSR